MKQFFSIGLMSGSSLDGLDICFSEIINQDEKYSYEILSGITLPFPDELYRRLKDVRRLSHVELEILDRDFGHWMANSCANFISRHSISHLDFIASHGHTVFHSPQTKETLQIGSGQILADVTRLPVINNFREKDMLLGGQGAPIVPIADLVFFPDIKYCLNLGGIMNLSIKEKGKIISSDIGVCNQLINYFAETLGSPYDKDGNFGRLGTLDPLLLTSIESHPFFSLPFPKSLDNSFSLELISICENYSSNTKNIIRTFYEHIVRQIKKFVVDKEKLLITGGGSHNVFLIEELIKNDLNLLPAENNLIDYKEALAMSLMGVRFIENKFNVLASVTGAMANSICGDIYLPKTK